MVLPAQKVLIVVQFPGNAHLMASGAELRCLVVIFQKSFLVKLRLGLHQLVVDKLQKLVRAERERIMNRFLDRIIRVAPCAVHVGDGVASGARNARMGGGMIYIVKFRVVERAREKNGTTS